MKVSLVGWVTFEVLSSVKPSNFVPKLYPNPPTLVPLQYKEAMYNLINFTSGLTKVYILQQDSNTVSVLDCVGLHIYYIWHCYAYNISA